MCEETKSTEVKEMTQGHTARKWQHQDQTQGQFDSKSPYSQSLK